MQQKSYGRSQFWHKLCQVVYNIREILDLQKKWKDIFGLSTSPSPIQILASWEAGNAHGKCRTCVSPFLYACGQKAREATYLNTK